MPISEIMDKLVILKLKYERIGKEFFEEEYLKYTEALVGTIVRKDIILDIFSPYDKLYEIHKHIWDLEADIRQCKIDNDLVEVGRRAIEIREWNKKRIEVKNGIASSLNEEKEVKKDHLSE